MLTRGAGTLPDPVLVRHRHARRSRAPSRPPCGSAGSYKATTKGGTDARHALPLPGEPGRLRLQSRRSPAPSASSGSTLSRPAANFGVVVTSRAPRRPRRAADRPRRRRAPPDRLRRAAVQPEPVPAHVRRARARRRHDPARGRRRTTSSSTAPRPRAPARSRSATGSTTSTPPALRAADAAREARRRLVVGASDRGSGVDPASLVVRIDGDEHAGRLTAGTDPHRRRTASATGRHALRVQVSDYQESRNMENVGRILPNTRILADDVRRPLSCGGPSPRSSAARRGRAGRSRRTPPPRSGSP